MGDDPELYIYIFFVIIYTRCLSPKQIKIILVVIYRLGGYDQLTCDQPWSVPLMFKILVSVPPVIFILISLLFLHRYPITELTRTETAKRLRAKRCPPIHRLCQLLANSCNIIHTGELLKIQI